MTKLLCGSTARWLALGLAMPAPAVAADLSVAPIYKALPAPSPTWTGSYIGLSGGGVWGNAVVRIATDRGRRNAAVRSAAAASSVLPPDSISKTATGSLALRATPRSPARRAAPFNCPRMPASTTRSRSAGFRPIRGRIGFAHDNWLLYATGGGALANVDNSIAARRRVQISDTQWHWGWTAGGGVEVKLNQDWSAKVEYLYVGLQDKSYFNPSPSVAFPE